jgi:thiopeptide-type bacteriocin biosynthesis protein
VTLATDTGSWTSLHCFVSWRTEHIDEFLTDVLAPLLDGLRAEGRITDWFFIRYWQGGPHMRVRFRSADARTAAFVGARLAELVAAMPYPAIEIESDRYYAALGGQAAASTAWHPHGEVVGIPYEPETERYGGVPALPVAEEVFCRSSEIAVAVVAATPVGRARLTAATELVMATATALGLDRQGAARWLRAHAASWRWARETAMLPAVEAQARAARVFEAQGPALGRRWESVARRVAGEPDSAVAAWAASVADARRRLEGDDAAPAAARWLWVWASQLHMLFNRLGVTPEEERSLCWVIASAAISPDGIAPFFADGADAPDRRYLEASKFLPGAEGQDPRADEDSSPPRPLLTRRRVELPAGPPPVAGLVHALRQRVSSRGRLTGPVTAADLGTLLWTAQGVLGTSEFTTPDETVHPVVHRPYPSAGGKYAARLSVIALDVPGLDPGCYRVDEVERALWWAGPAPTVADLEGTSGWFGADSVGFGGVDLTELPAMLALHVRHGALRTRYGLRALRFALTEAGHLAQNLSLVAASTGLAMGVIGGFYDDVAHEVTGLDGMDDMLVYLLPLGRLVEAEQTPGAPGDGRG